MEDIREYLLNRVRSDSPARTPRSVQLMRMQDTEGVDILDFVIDDQIEYARKFIQRCFKRSKVRGECALTQVSMAIGKYVIEGFDSNNTNFRDHIRVGDLFVEAFVMCDYLDITVGHLKTRKPVTIHALDKWGEIEVKVTGNHSITENIIPAIRTLFQDNGKPVVKGWEKNKEGLFIKHRDAPFVKAIDKLQATRWIVNKDVHQAILDHYDHFVTNEEFTGDNEKENEKLRQRQASKNRETKEIMATAETWLDKQFSFFVDADYRGRLYYSEPFFNYQGSDISRGQLLFAKGKLFDSNASFWLAVHTATSYNQSYGINEIPEWVTADYKAVLEEEGLDTLSVDKMTLEDRARWTNEHIDFILRLGKLKTIVFDAEKPISFLACCIEWHKYSVCEGDFYTQLPVGIDGSSNGWQHLGAMSKDQRTGELVGLVPQEIQNDFYVQIAKRLVERMPEWFEERNIPMKDIRKGIAKRAAMTRAYSCGQQKMSQSMYSDCYQYGFTENYNITEWDCDELASQVIRAINEVCPGPLETMRYLQHKANQEINNWMTTYGTDRGYGIRWVTPSGFPVIYECYRTRPQKVDCYGFCTPRGALRFKHVVREKTDIPDRRGFATGISPNFVHSMDAAHMHLTINKWSDDFGAVHDSFATHSTNIEKLMDLTRNTFVGIYDVDNFYESIPFGKSDAIEQPRIGELNIKEVVNSDYFFC